MINYVGIALLFLSILFTGRQVNLYMRMSKRMGKVVLALSPTILQKKALMIGGIAFVVLLCVVTYNYISQDIPLNVSYTGLLAVVIFSVGRLFGSIVELRDGGLLGKLNEIDYADIKSYSYAEQGKKHLVRFQLKDGREFATLASVSDKDALRSVMEKMKKK